MKALPLIAVPKDQIAHRRRRLHMRDVREHRPVLQLHLVLSVLVLARTILLGAELAGQKLVKLANELLAQRRTTANRLLQIGVRRLLALDLQVLFFALAARQASLADDSNGVAEGQRVSPEGVGGVAAARLEKRVGQAQRRGAEGP